MSLHLSKCHIVGNHVSRVTSVCSESRCSTLPNHTFVVEEVCCTLMRLTVASLCRFFAVL